MPSAAWRLAAVLLLVLLPQEAGQSGGEPFDDVLIGIGVEEDSPQPALALVEGQGEKDALLRQQCSLNPSVQGIVSSGGQPGRLEAETEEIGLGGMGEMKAEIGRFLRSIVGSGFTPHSREKRLASREG